MLKIYNTLTREKEVFKPRKGKKVQMFVCGPTVYDFSHIGHARTYIFYDNFVNYLRYLGYKVFYLQNITDIDDKIIQQAKSQNINWKKIARVFEKEYLKDIKALGIKSVTKYARATNHIKEIQSQVKRLLKKGYAYQMKDGIYYDIKKFKDYGKLSRRTIEQAEDAVSRVDLAETKRNKGDFCLWKFSKPSEPKWYSSFGVGRPGWHIEDTAIAEKYFGFQYDIHGGARDLIFPHHEAEIALMEALSEKAPMVKYWIHSGFLTANGRKMSKSIGNFITIRDFLKQHNPYVFRFIVFSYGYNSSLDYSEKIAKESETNLETIKEFLRHLKKIKSVIQRENAKLINAFKKDVFKRLEDDFDTVRVKALIFSFMSEINQKIAHNQISAQEAKEIYKFFKQINKIFKFLNFKEIEKKKNVPKEIKRLMRLRVKYRAEKNWQKADEIRKQIQELGYKVKDTKSNNLQG